MQILQKWCFWHTFWHFWVRNWPGAEWYGLQNMRVCTGVMCGGLYYSIYLKFRMKNCPKFCEHFSHPCAFSCGQWGMERGGGHMTPLHMISHIVGPCRDLLYIGFFLFDSDPHNLRHNSRHAENMFRTILVRHERFRKGKSQWDSHARVPSYIILICIKFTSLISNSGVLSFQIFFTLIKYEIWTEIFQS